MINESNQTVELWDENDDHISTEFVDRRHAEPVVGGELPNLNSVRNGVAVDKIIIFVLLGALLVGGLVFGAFTLLKGRLDKADEPEKTTTTRTFSSPPPSLGRYEPPPPKPQVTEKKSLSQASSSEEVAQANQLMLAQQQSANELLLRRNESSLATTPEKDKQEKDTQNATDSPLAALGSNPLLGGSVAAGGNAELAKALGANPALVAASVANPALATALGNPASSSADSSSTSTTTVESNPGQPSHAASIIENIDYTLIKGTTIPCALETNITTQNAGFTSCVITQDVYSSNSRILLIEKGSKITGRYTGGLRLGDTRLMVVWDRVVTPFDVAIRLNSPSTGRLGQSGIAGEVDNRWGLRIGSALMISMIGDALQYAKDSSNKGKENKSNGQVVINTNGNRIDRLETAKTAQKAGEQILSQSIALPPIIYVEEGKIINIYVAKDIDMSNIYNVNEWGY